jgi:hypothetical protein
MIVALSPEDVGWAREIGRKRIALSPGNPRFAYKERNGLDTHTVGAMAELAAARGLGIPWPARVNTFRSLPDLDPFWEVRWSSNPKQVKVSTDDPPHYLVLHVTGSDPIFEVHGFIVARWAQENRPLEDPGNRGWSAHFARSYHLTPVDPHTVCLYAKDWGPTEGWMCIICGEKYEVAA